MNCAFIDIGTNSIRLLLVKIDREAKSFMVLSDQKETVRLGDSEFIDGYLQPEAIDRAKLVIAQFAEMARANHSEFIAAVATSATREARNKGQFISLLNDAAQINVHTISGTEEARLIYLGVVNSLNLKGQAGLFIDIGGGSTELVVGTQQQYLHLESLKLGAIRLATLFPSENESGIVSKKQYQFMQSHIRSTAIRSVQRIAKEEFQIAYGSSGTIEALGDVMALRDFGRPRNLGDVFSYQQIEESLTFLSSLSLDERTEIPGLNSRRADIIITGGSILHTLAEMLDLKEIRITDRGLRDGLLMDFLQKEFPDRWGRGESVRLLSVTQLAQKCGIDQPHAEKVRELALTLFDQSRALGLHQLKKRHREILGYAAILHDVGIFLGYSNHELHSYYLVRNSDMLGFDNIELSLIAALCYFHRKRFPRRKHSALRAMDKQSYKAVRVMAPLLRIAESMDRSHQNAVDSVILEKDGEELVLTLQCRAQGQLELWGAEGQAHILAKVFKIPIRIESRWLD